MQVADAIRSRKSVRRFRPDPVPRAQVERILELAAQAPSGANTQPWKVRALAGAARDALCRAVSAAAEQEPQRHHAEYGYYPDPGSSLTSSAGGPWASASTTRSASPAATGRRGSGRRCATSSSSMHRSAC
ncbi:nitroreductase family protein [Azotobacter chroococcum]